MDGNARYGPPVAVDGGGTSLDYYLVFAGADDRGRGAPPSGNLIEEFLLCDDYTAAGLDSVEWTPATGAWRDSPASSRGIRVDPLLRERVVAVSRREAGDAYTMLGGGELPREASIRGLFHDGQPLPAAAPLDLGPPGGGGPRLYRILFAGELGERGLANLWQALRLEPAGDPADPRTRVVGTATATVVGHVLTWELRRIGPGIAWCLDVTVRLGTGPSSAVGALLHHHRQAIREQGLIPVTIERFA
ncbi:hypothetical protein [Streptosporangium lutulentum]|uniref:Uncharacterized protein n=1 Tax=Streptosporangium lutulentum TaxID=1461250 RepID=A0ABT9Q7C2_9ACTN|nr:hypothetical protein [Streptosporangium lutulentum]MDP9842639.1 hypothetical protein [Streptosporangium lutulentum]